jgi:hypothetical protein
VTCVNLGLQWPIFEETLADWEKARRRELRDKPLSSLNWTTPEGIVVGAALYGR